MSVVGSYIIPQGSYVCEHRIEFPVCLVLTFNQPAGEVKWYVGRHLLNRVLLPMLVTMSAVRTSGPSEGAVVLYPELEFCARADPST